MPDIKDFVSMQLELKKANLAGSFYDQLAQQMPDILDRMSNGNLTAADALILGIITK